MLEKIIDFLVGFYLEPNSFHIFIYALLLLSALILISFIILRFIQFKKKSKEKIRTHLKNEQEEAIFNILFTKKGTCYQSTLSHLSRIPKSTLSEILDELEKRNIIKKTKKGNKNLISIK